MRLSYASAQALSCKSQTADEHLSICAEYECHRRLQECSVEHKNGAWAACTLHSRSIGGAKMHVHTAGGCTYTAHRVETLGEAAKGPQRLHVQCRGLGGGGGRACKLQTPAVSTPECGGTALGRYSCTRGGSRPGRCNCTEAGPGREKRGICGTDPTMRDNRR